MFVKKCTDDFLRVLNYVLLLYITLVHMIRKCKYIGNNINLILSNIFYNNYGFIELYI